MAKYTEEHIGILKDMLSKGYTYVAISKILNRTPEALCAKANKLGLYSKNNKRKTTEEYKKEVPKDIIVLGEYKTNKTKILHKHKLCGYEYYIRPSDVLNGIGCSKCSGKLHKNTESYKKELPEDIIILEEYINAKTKILHKHLTCNTTWMVKPNKILSGRGCPECNRGGFNNKNPGWLYLIEFPANPILYNVYKLGISNNYINRLSELGEKYNIIMLIYFDIGINARVLEREYLNNVKDLLVDTGELISGNTETFYYE